MRYDDSAKHDLSGPNSKYVISLDDDVGNPASDRIADGPGEVLPNELNTGTRWRKGAKAVQMSNKLQASVEPARAGTSDFDPGEGGFWGRAWQYASHAVKWGYFDLYSYYDVEKDEMVSTYFSLLGTLVALAGLAFFAVNCLGAYAADDISISVNYRHRKAGEFARIPQVSLQALLDGQAFQNDTMFQVSFTYRAIFDGDSNNDVRPRIYINTQPIDCRVYYDLQATEDERAQWLREGTKTGVGRHVAKGCVNLTDIQVQLDAMREKSTAALEEGLLGGNPADEEPRPLIHPDDIPLAPIIQGEYGDPAYWFLHIKFLGCPEYGPTQAIDCNYDSFEWDKYSLNIDLAFPRQVSKWESSWGNIYVNVQENMWTGLETYIELVRSDESRRDIPTGIAESVDRINLGNAVYRQQTRKQTSLDHFSFYIRMSGTVGEEFIKHYSFMSALSDIGGSKEVVFVLGSGLFMYLPRLLFRMWAKTEKVRERVVHSAESFASESGIARLRPGWDLAAHA